MRLLSHVSIRNRLIIAMALSILLLAVVGLSSLVFMATVNRATHELHSHWLPAVRILSATKYTMESHRLRFVRALLTPDQQVRQEVFKAAGEREKDVRALLDDLVARPDTIDEHAYYIEARRRWEIYLGEEEAIRAKLPTASETEIADLVNNRSRVAFNDMNAAIDSGIETSNRGAIQAGAGAVATFNRAMSINLAIFVVALALLVVFVILVVTSVSRPIERITEAMHRLAGGDRTASVAGLEGANEIGRMAAAVDVFRDYLIERDAARAALERVNEDLEEKVAARNAELMRTNASLQQEIEERTLAARQLKAMQEELIRTENLAVIGQLSAGIAHELNQPLAALGTLSENAAEFLKAGDADTARFNLERIAKLVERMGVLTGQLRSFARRSDGEAVDLDVATSVENALALIGHRLRKDGITVDVATPDQHVTAHANAIRLEQILVNLIGNALDATATRADPEIRISFREVADRTIIDVEDNGIGLEAGMEERVFEPFFTTKAKGGLGLGLAISADIARSFNGTLTAEARPEGGARFRLDIPTRAEGALAHD